MEPIVTTSTCHVPLPLLARRVAWDGAALALGDVVEIEVVRPGFAFTGETIEARTNRGDIRWVPWCRAGVRLLAAVGNREAADEYDAEVPSLGCDEVDVAAPCGLVGRVLARAAGVGAPTTARLVSRVVDARGATVNTRRHPEFVSTPHRSGSDPSPRLTIVVADRMNAGKTTCAKRIVAALSLYGGRVAAGKATGTAKRSSIEGMRPHGAIAVADFSSFGLPSTCGVDRRALENTARGVVHALSDAAGIGGHVVLELADGFDQRETTRVLQMPWLRQRLWRLVFCVRDAARVNSATSALRDLVGFEPSLLSGRALTDDAVAARLAAEGREGFDAARVSSAVLHRLLEGAPEPRRAFATRRGVLE